MSDPSTRITEVLKREARDLLSYFAWRVGNRDDADDLLSETMVVAWRQVAAVPEDDLEARLWLFGVARNVLAGHRRATRRRSNLTNRLIDQSATESWSATLEGNSVDHEQDVHSYLRLLLTDLPPVDQEIITLHHWTGFTLKEIGGLLSMRESTVRSRYHRARNALRATLIDANELPLY